MIPQTSPSGHCCEVVIVTALRSQPSGVPPDNEAETISVYGMCPDGLTKAQDPHINRTSPVRRLREFMVQ